MEYYLAIKRNEITAFLATWMDLEIIMQSEVSQTMRHQHQMLSLGVPVVAQWLTNPTRNH